MTPEQAQKMIALAERRNSLLSQIAWAATISMGVLVVICAVITHRLP